MEIDSILKLIDFLNEVGYKSKEQITELKEQINDQKEAISESKENDLFETHKYMVDKIDYLQGLIKEVLGSVMMRDIMHHNLKLVSRELSRLVETIEEFDNNFNNND